MPRVTWTATKSEQFWRRRRLTKVTVDHNVERRNDIRFEKRIEHLTRQQRRRDEFLQRYRTSGQCSLTSAINTEEAADLCFWIEHMSWTFCQRCKKLEKKKLLPSFRQRKGVTSVKTCSCVRQRYVTPCGDNVPPIFFSLTEQDIEILRPLKIYTGLYQRRSCGYRVRTEPFYVKWQTLKVPDRIAAIPDITQRQRVQQAYEFLMRRPSCSYQKFIRMHNGNKPQPWRFEIFTNPEYQGVESALWPHLYFDDELCESFLDGSETRLSAKIAFQHKVFSNVADYALLYDLLLYHYDRWLFRTVSGAINTAAASGCSPSASLQGKPFSFQYWQDQYRLLKDAVKQHGYPSFFLTISPYEWTFPVPPWITTIRYLGGKDVTEIPTLQTEHIAHTLEQIVRGFLCGKNTNRWRKHIFCDTSAPRNSNVVTYFYRFEFQQRGTVHLHMLVWLHDLSKIRYDEMSATVPWENLDDAFDVTTLQSSDKTVLKLQEDDTHISEQHDQVSLRFKYTKDDKERKIRAYLKPLLSALQCRTDVQCSDGKGMILKYVSSYVTKCHDALQSELLHSRDTTGFQAASSFLRSMAPLEPEMWMSLSQTKVAWTPSKTKVVTALTPEYLDKPSYQKYLSRNQNDESLSYLQWLRVYDDSKTTPQRYKGERSLVGVRMLSIFNPLFFFQHMVMNIAHRKTNTLFHVAHDRLPRPIVHFAQAYTLQPQLWSDESAIRTFFEPEGHKEFFLKTILFFLRSLQDVLKLWRISVVNSSLNSADILGNRTLFPLSPRQRSIRDYLITLLEQRRSEISAPARRHDPILPDVARNPRDTTWSTIQIIHGYPGTGKSQVLKSLIAYCLEEDLQVAFGSPLGILARAYTDIFGWRILSDTIHALFHIPVTTEQCYTVNYSLARRDVVILDEVSMVTKPMFELMMNTLNKLPRRPVVILAGDSRQQPPLVTRLGRVRQGISILSDETLRVNCEHHQLRQQFRILDPSYLAFLDLVRVSRPNDAQLATFQTGKVLLQQGNVTDAALWQVKEDHPDHTFLTVTREGAARLNSIMIRHIFRNKPVLGSFCCDNEYRDFPVYKNMPVFITQNRDKDAGVVNGQSATVINVERQTVLLRLPDNSVVFTYPVTVEGDNGTTRTVFPFTPAFATTICKSLGANLTKVILWVDTNFVPQGTTYVGLSRVRRAQDIRLLTPLATHHFRPVETPVLF